MTKSLIRDPDLAKGEARKHEQLQLKLNFLLVQILSKVPVVSQENSGKKSTHLYLSPEENEQ
jgi:hypothetical protein